MESMEKQGEKTSHLRSCYYKMFCIFLLEKVTQMIKDYQNIFKFIIVAQSFD